MDEVIHVRKAENEAPNAAPAAPLGHKKHSGSPRGSKFSYWWILHKVIALIVIVAVIFGVWAAIGYMNDRQALSGVNKSEYQAVFLTNGQAYFGKIADINSNFVKITNIYYLQAQQSATSVQPASSSSQSTQLSLVKLGNEIHGPEDSMFIARDQVLFWENLKNSGKVVQAILSSHN